MITSAAPPALGEERVPPGEAAAVSAILSVSNDLLDTATAPVPRQQHGKGHGVVRGEFRVARDLAPVWRHGVFSEPRSYPALVRFSNGGERDESQKDAHGMAIKLFGVEGARALAEPRDATTQDFVLLDHPTFFVRDAIEYAAFAVALRNAVLWSRSGWTTRVPRTVQKLALLAHLYWHYLRARPYERRQFLQIRKKPPVEGIAERYWSVTPYRLGPHAVRWSVRRKRGGATDAHTRPAAGAGAPENGLHDRLVGALAREEIEFEFLAQRQIDPVAMPVEDPTLAWSEQASPAVVLATLRLPPQRFDTAQRIRLSESLSFSPWNALEAHRPLGGINRARGLVYAALARRRRELNRAALHEPDAAWLREQWDAEGAGA